MPLPCRVLLLDPIDPKNPRAGGAQVHICQVFGRLVKRGVAVTWLASSFPGASAEERICGLDVRRLGRLATYYPKATAICARETRRAKHDLVVECLNKIPFYSPLYARVPVLALCHHLFGEVAFLQVPWPVAAAVWTTERGLRWAYRHTPFVTISESSRGDLIRRGVRPENVQVIHCGVDPPSLSVDTEEPRPLRVAYLGRLEPYKKVDVLLQAMKVVSQRLPAVEIVIIGKGSAQDRLRRLCRDLDLESRTRFTGFVERAERDALLSQSRVCVCPSVKEGWGLVVTEANAVGTPVVAADAPGLRDSVRDGETGFLVQRDDVAGFARRIVELLESDELARRLSGAALAWSRRFDWEQSADEMEGALEAAR